MGTIVEGGALGRLEFRLQCGSTAQDNDSVKSAGTGRDKGKGGKGGAVTVSEELKVERPSLFALPFECVRKTNFTIRSVEYKTPEVVEGGTVEGSIEAEGPPQPYLVYGEPILLWAKKPTLEDAGDSKQRFPPRCTIVMCDASGGTSATSWGQASTILYNSKPEVFPPVVAISFIDAESEMFELEQAYDESSKISVAAYPIAIDTTASVKIGEAEAMDQAAIRQSFSTNYFCTIMDFSINSTAVLSHHFASEDGKKKKYR